ncbi:MAG: hypothetical protein ACYTF6_05010 [Planctomycetota bacterium]|jgi:hypothetical protein
MTKLARLYVLCLVAAAILAAGCGPKKAKTPKEAVVNVYKAVDQDDKDLFMANVTCEDPNFPETFFDAMTAMREFTKEFVKKYGKGKMGEHGEKARAPGPKEIGEEARITTYATIPDQAKPTRLTIEDGYWKMDLTEMLEGEEGRRFREVLSLTPSAVKKALKKIGQEQYEDNPEKIITELVAETTGLTLRRQPEPVQEAKTPKEAIVNIHKAVEKGDKGLFMANVNIADKELGEAVFDAMSAMLSFIKKFRNEYGKDKLGEDFAFYVPTAEEVAEKVKIEKEDGKATATLAGDKTVLVEKDGKWKADMSDMDKEPEIAKPMLKMIASAAKEAEKKIGKAEYKDNPQEILSEMMTDIRGADMEPMGR